MPFLVAAVVLVAALAVVNLLLSFGVIRRLREHTELLARHGHGAHAGAAVMTESGGAVGRFLAVTVDDEPVSSDQLAGTTLVGFFTPSCKPCAERVPQFVEYASSHAGGRGHVLAVVAADEGEQAAAPLVAQLASVARVVREAEHGPVQDAFAVRGFPALGLIVDGVVRASGFAMSDLTAAAAAV